MDKDIGTPKGLSCATDWKFLSFLWYNNCLLPSCSEGRKILIRLYNLLHLYKAKTYRFIGIGNISHNVPICAGEKCLQ